MRILYISLIKVICSHVKNNNLEELPELLISLNNEDSPKRDMDISNFLTELYIFVTFGYQEKTYPEGFRNWDEVEEHITKLDKV